MKPRTHLGWRVALLGTAVASSFVLARPVPTTATAPATRLAAGSPEEVLREAVAEFRYRGKPIHPALIAAFVGGLSDGGPVVRSVDVTAAWGTDQYGGRHQVLGDGTVEYTVPNTDPGETFSYRRLGAFDDGTQVLRAALNGGGSGVFGTLLLVRFRTGADGALLLEVKKSVPLGDRDDGRIEVRRDRVVLGVSKNRRTEQMVLAGD